MMMSQVCLALCALLSISLFASETQTWTSKNGHSFEGRYLSSDVASVKLKGDSGRVVTVPLNALDENSVKQVQDARAELGENLPVFSHANPFLRYSLYPGREWLQVEFLRGGQAIHSEPFVLRFDHAEVRDGRWTPMKFKKMVGDPIKTRDEVELQLEMSNGVIVRLFTKIGSAKELEFRCEIAPPPEGLPRLHARVRLDVPEVLTYDEDLKAYIGSFSQTPLMFKDLPRALDGYEISMRDQGKLQKLPYYEKLESSLKGNYAEIHHPDWPVLSLQGTKVDGCLRSRFYGGKMPVNGYTIYFESDDAQDPLQKGGPFIMSLK